MSTENTFRRFLGRVPNQVFRPQRGGALFALLRAIDRELGGQCPLDDGTRCSAGLNSNYQGPGCRNKSCPRYAGKEGLQQLLELAAQQVQLLTARGTYLEIWASFLNVRRRDAEDDDLFLTRLVAEAFAPRVTKAALLARIRPYYSGKEDQVTIEEYERPFTADIGFVIFEDPGDDPEIALIPSTDPSVLPDQVADPAICVLAVLEDGYITDGRLDAFNAQLGLWPYQFAVYVPYVDSFASGFVFEDSYAQALEDAGKLGQLNVGVFLHEDDPDHPELFDGANQNFFVYDLPSWRRANANRDVRETVRINKAAGTQPLFRPFNTEVSGLVLG